MSRHALPGIVPRPPLRETSLNLDAAPAGAKHHGHLASPQFLETLPAGFPPSCASTLSSLSPLLPRAGRGRADERDDADSEPEDAAAADARKAWRATSQDSLLAAHSEPLGEPVPEPIPEALPAAPDAPPEQGLRAHCGLFSEALPEVPEVPEVHELLPAPVRRSAPIPIPPAAAPAAAAPARGEPPHPRPGRAHLFPPREDSLRSWIANKTRGLRAHYGLGSAVPAADGARAPARPGPAPRARAGSSGSLSLLVPLPVYEPAGLLAGAPGERVVRFHYGLHGLAPATVLAQVCGGPLERAEFADSRVALHFMFAASAQRFQAYASAGRFVVLGRQLIPDNAAHADPADPAAAAPAGPAGSNKDRAIARWVAQTASLAGAAAAPALPGGPVSPVAESYLDSPASAAAAGEAGEAGEAAGTEAGNPTEELGALLAVGARRTLRFFRTENVSSLIVLHSRMDVDRLRAACESAGWLLALRPMFCRKQVAYVAEFADVRAAARVLAGLDGRQAPFDGFKLWRAEYVRDTTERPCA